MIAKGEKLPNMVIGGYDKEMWRVHRLARASAKRAGMPRRPRSRTSRPASRSSTGEVKSNTGKVITSKDTPLYTRPWKPPTTWSKHHRQRLIQANSMAARALPPSSGWQQGPLVPLRLALPKIGCANPVQNEMALSQ